MRNMQDILRQAQKMQAKMMKAQEELAELKVEGEAAGGMVKVTVDGKSDILCLKINPEIVDPQDVEMLEDTILAAIRDGIDKSRKLAEEKMGSVTGGMKGFPGMGF